MPVYQFRCNDTGKPFEVRMSISEYDPNKVTSPFSGTHNVSRLIERVTFARVDGVTSQLKAGQPASLDALGNQDPKQLAYTMRSLADESGGKTSDEFTQVVSRLEKGQRPAEIEKSVPVDSKGKHNTP